MKRREFLASAGASAAMAALGPGCQSLLGARAFYGPTIRDRLWMWGHSNKIVTPSRPFAHPGGVCHCDMSEACAKMGIPNCCVVRWMGLPKPPFDEWVKTLAPLKRVAWSVVDGAPEPFEKKLEMALALQPKLPNLTTVYLDDFFTPQKLSRPKSVRALADRLHERGLRLACVFYPDQEGIRPEFRDDLMACDEISTWIWNGRNIAKMRDSVMKLRDFVGAEKPLLLGQYMWEFNAPERPQDPALMREQLATAHELLRGQVVTGLIFHPTFVADLDYEAVRISKAWIAENGEEKVG